MREKLQIIEIRSLYMEYMEYMEYLELKPDIPNPCARELQARSIDIVNCVGQPVLSPSSSTKTRTKASGSRPGWPHKL